MIVQLNTQKSQKENEMKLQQTIATPSAFPVGVVKTVEEILAAENQKDLQQTELEQRKEFVERIEAFCDCV